MVYKPSQMWDLYRKKEKEKHMTFKKNEYDGILNVLFNIKKSQS